MRIDNLYQYGTYRLVFPLTINGVPVASIIDAKFLVYDAKNNVIEVTMDSGDVTFVGGKLFVHLKSINTINLDSNYTYEVWVKLEDDNPYHVRQGSIQFNKTKARF